MTATELLEQHFGRPLSTTLRRALAAYEADAAIAPSAIPSPSPDEVERVALAIRTYGIRIWGAPHLWAVIKGSEWDKPIMSGMTCEIANIEAAKLNAAEAIAAMNRAPQETPRVIDNYKDEITVSLGGRELRGWSYTDDSERRQKMLQAREYVEGYYKGATL